MVWHGQARILNDKGLHMSTFHHQKLPAFSTLLSGHTPRDTVGFRSERLQIWYNNTEETWKDPAPHYHTDSDEIFIVLRGSIVVEVEGERYTIQAGEFCCFPVGVYHSVVEVFPPVESFMIRAPSIEDKVYQK
jgi:mannose-6-phosphate isomerase-like protein (cupin superfamily)